MLANLGLINTGNKCEVLVVIGKCKIAHWVVVPNLVRHTPKPREIDSSSHSLTPLFQPLLLALLNVYLSL